MYRKFAGFSRPYTRSTVFPRLAPVPGCDCRIMVVLQSVMVLPGGGSQFVKLHRSNVIFGERASGNGPWIQRCFRLIWDSKVTLMQAPGTDRSVCFPPRTSRRFGRLDCRGSDLAILQKTL